MLRALLSQLLAKKKVQPPSADDKRERLLAEARALRDAGDWPAAQAAYSKVLEGALDHPEALLALANLALLQGGHDAAVTLFERYLAIEPGNLQARNILGGVYGTLGNLDAALRCYARVIEADPNFEQVAHVALLLSAFDPELDAVTRREVHEAWARRHADPLSDDAPLPEVAPNTGRRRVGYVSAFLCNHPIADFVAPILRHHHRADWEVFVYSDVAAPDAVTAALRGLDLHWRDCAGSDDAAFTAKVREDRIDVLVDLAGHNATNRLRAFARRLAPVQITGIGYAGTTGMAAMDYRLADPVADPVAEPRADSHYSERLLRLPRCLWCYEPPAAMPLPGPLPAGEHSPVTFVSLNAAIKLTDATLQAWGAVLAAVPDSRLIIATVVEGSPRRRILNVLARQGVDAARIAFEPLLKREKFWNLYHRADIALDTWPCNGGTTTFEALWGGLPVIALAGSEFRSRAGLAILSAAGLGDLVANDVDEYLRIAIDLAADRPRLAALRAGMRERLRGAGLLDGAKYAGELESCYREALRQRGSEAQSG